MDKLIGTELIESLEKQISDENNKIKLCGVNGHNFNSTTSNGKQKVEVPYYTGDVHMTVRRTSVDYIDVLITQRLCVNCGLKEIEVK